MSEINELRERLAKAEAELKDLLEQKPVAIVEYSDYQTAAAIVGDEPKKIAVRELFDGALRLGESLYTAPVAAPAVPADTTIAYQIEWPDGTVELSWEPDGYDEDYVELRGVPYARPLGEIICLSGAPAPAVPVGDGWFYRDGEAAIRTAAPSVPEECPNCKKAWSMLPIAWYRKRGDGGIDGPLMDYDSRMCATRRKEWTPLYERPFYPDFLNYRQGFNDGIEEIRYELKQLCKDFSDMQNRPYMGDVHAQVDAICERALLQSPQATPAVPVPSVPEEWRDKLLTEFPLLDEEGLCQEKHHCEWTLLQDRKRLHALLQSAEGCSSQAQNEVRHD